MSKQIEEVMALVKAYAAMQGIEPMTSRLTLMTPSRPSCASFCQCGSR